MSITITNIGNVKDQDLIVVLNQIFTELDRRHGIDDPLQEQEITGLETLISAIQELEDELES